MAFNPQLLVKLEPSSLFTQPATIPQVKPALLPPQFWLYQAGNDSIATVEANYYFVYFADWLNTLEYNNGQFFNIGDLIYCVCSNGNVWLEVTQVVGGIETQVATASAGSVVAASLAAGAVTAPALGAGAVTTPALATNTIQYAIVPMTLAQFQGMYAAPYQILAAPGAGNVINVLSWYISMTYGSAQLTTGGATALQFGSTVHGAGVLATATIPAASLTGITANEQVGSNGSMGVGANANTAVYISNATAPFAVGTGATFNIIVSYMIGTL
jgi:hypothetical protein